MFTVTLPTKNFPVQKKMGTKRVSIFLYLTLIFTFCKFLNKNQQFFSRGSKGAAGFSHFNKYFDQLARKQKKS